jgi:hypothetical protein
MMQTSWGLSTDWREMFGLRSFYAKGNVEKATRRRENNSWSRENRTMAWVNCDPYSDSLTEEEADAEWDEHWAESV